MNKSSAFQVGVVDGILEKEAFLGKLLKKTPKPGVVGRAARFAGHKKELGKALSSKTNARGVVSKKILDPATGKYRVQKHIEL
jgi:hypothetical protein